MGAFLVMGITFLAISLFVGVTARIFDIGVDCCDTYQDEVQTKGY